MKKLMTVIWSLLNAPRAYEDGQYALELEYRKPRRGHSRQQDQLLF